MRHLRTLALSLLLAVSGLTTAQAQPAKPLESSDLRALPFTLNGEPAFEQGDGWLPFYFCQFSDIPVELPLDKPEKTHFFLVDGLLGISRSQDGRILVHQLKVFLSIDKSGAYSRQTTERTFVFQPEEVTVSDAKIFLVSDEKATDNPSERRTEVSVDRQSGEGYIRNVVWESGDRKQEPSFDFSYGVRGVEVKAD